MSCYILLVALAFNPWGPSGCTAQAPVGANQEDQWYTRTDCKPTWIFHVKAGQVIGCYDSADDTYAVFDQRAGSYGKWSDPPWGKQEQNFGINQQALADRCRNGPCYYINGRQVTRSDVFEAITAGTQLEDDSGKNHLTIIGSKEETKPVLEDLESNVALTGYKGKLLVQVYKPDCWAAARAGFKTDGKPSIYLQAPGGKVLHRQDGYKGPLLLAAAIRKADPNYDPAKDPDLTKPKPATPAKPNDADPIAAPPFPWPAAGCIALLVAAMLFMSRKASQHHGQ